MIPAAPNTTGTSLSGSEVNDGSCETDGVFDFYITDADMTSWGLDPNVKTYVLYIRGNSVLGETHTLSLKDPTPGDGTNPGGGTTGPATQVILEKTWPTGFAGSGQCEYFSASLRDASNRFVTTAANVTFSLDKMIASTVSSNIVGYDNQADCIGSTNSKTTFTIPGGKNTLFVYYRMPDAPIDGTISFRASNVSLATTTSAYLAVKLRDSAAGRFWISSFAPYKVSKGMCTRGNFDARLYNGSWKSPLIWTPAVTGTGAANLFFYSDADCLNKITAIDGTSGNTYYFKYTGVTVSPTNLSLTITHSINIATFGDYDDIPQKLEIDLSGNTTVAHFDFYTQDQVPRGVCNQTQIQTYNSQGALVTPNIYVTLASSAVTRFFTNQADCDTDNNPVVSPLQITSPQTPLYYRVYGAPGTSQSFTFTSTGLNTPARTFEILNKATTVTALFNGLKDLVFTYPSANVCTPMNIEAVLSDAANDGTAYVNNFGENKIVNIYLPAGYTIYSDASCINAEAGNLVLSVDMNANTSGPIIKYIKANSTPTASSFYVNQATGGASGYLMSTNPSLVIGP
jgi:hypothetical protein